MFWSVDGRLNPRTQGDLGEWSAMNWLADHGYTVFLPVGHSPDVDMIAVRGRETLRVQVKTSCRFVGGRWEVMICTRGGNQSWNGVVKHFGPDRCDRLFVVAGDGRRWLIPAAEVGATSGLRLGGPKYARFEVEQGSPLVRSRAA